MKDVQEEEKVTANVTIIVKNKRIVMETNLRLEHVAKEKNVYAEHVNVRIFSTFLI
jgi:hypothetical protein